VDVQSLAVQKGELDTQLSERKARLAQCKKDQQQEEETLQSLRSAIKKHTNSGAKLWGRVRSKLLRQKVTRSFILSLTVTSSLCSFWSNFF